MTSVTTDATLAMHLLPFLPMTNQVRIVPATAAHIQQCIELLATTFSKDPNTQAFFPEGADITPYLRHDFRATLRAYLPEHATLDVAMLSDAPSTICGAALWLKPHPKPRLMRQLKALPERLKAVPSIRALPRIVRLGRIFQAAEPAQPYWYLSHIAVSPEARGQGVASALLEHRLQHIDGKAYLEATSEASSRLYARHGFEPRDTLDIDGTACVTMLRKAD